MISKERGKRFGSVNLVKSVLEVTRNASHLGVRIRQESLKLMNNCLTPTRNTNAVLNGQENVSKLVMEWCERMYGC